MYKRFLLTALLNIFILSINAQWGILGGVNTSRSTDSDANEQALGFQIGAYREIHLVKGFYLKPQILFSNENLNKKIDGERSIIKYQISSVNQLRIRENAFYLTIPISVTYKIPVKNRQNLIIGFGGYASCGLFGQSYYEVWKSEVYWKSPNDNTFPYRKRFDSGIIASISYEMNNFIYSIDAKYGLMNIDPLSDRTGKLETYFFNIGYKF